MKATKKVKITPYNLKTISGGEEFTMQFSGRNSKGTLIKVDIEMQDWWIKIMLKDFRAVIAKKQEWIDELNKAFEKQEATK